MKKSWFMIVVLVLLMPAIVVAQGRGGRPKGGNNGGKGGNNGGSSKEAPASRPEKPADLSAVSITARWKDANTLEVTAVVKNGSTTAFSGIRTVTLKVQGKDGKSETLKDETLPMIEAGASHKLVFESTDAKYLDKDLKWTLEIAAGDPTASNDKKIVSLTIPPKPKAS
jgi:hypothetical protein